MNTDYQRNYERLFEVCDRSDFLGHDPFDGLNSRIFQASPFRGSTFARLAWLQMIKRSPLNLRGLLKVEKGRNPKGVALFALAELSRLRAEGKSKNAGNAERLLDMLLGLKLEVETVDIDPGRKTAWGYNFDWQSRAFFAPQGTPTIVPTAFAAFALLEGFESLKKPEYLETAEEVCRFITGALNRPVETETELCFSYTPIDGNVIYNASLLAGEVLARVGALTGNDEYLKLAEKSARFVVNRQDENGSWAYGPKLRHGWVDNFHTAFILGTLKRLKDTVPAVGGFTDDPFRKGLNYWLENFFLPDGTPKYYDKSTYPVDIHSVAAALVTLGDLWQTDERCPSLSGKIAEWVTANMWDEKGFFYYRVNRFYRTKIPFMRWNNAWMALALARYLECRSFEKNA